MRVWPEGQGRTGEVCVLAHGLREKRREEWGGRIAKRGIKGVQQHVIDRALPVVCIKGEFPKGEYDHSRERVTEGRKVGPVRYAGHIRRGRKRCDRNKEAVGNPLKKRRVWSPRALPKREVGTVEKKKCRRGRVALGCTVARGANRRKVLTLG